MLGIIFVTIQQASDQYFALIGTRIGYKHLNGFGGRQQTDYIQIHPTNVGAIIHYIFPRNFIFLKISVHQAVYGLSQFSRCRWKYRQTRF